MSLSPSFSWWNHPSQPESFLMSAILCLEHGESIEKESKAMVVIKCTVLSVWSGTCIFIDRLTLKHTNAPKLIGFFLKYLHFLSTKMCTPCILTKHWRLYRRVVVANACQIWMQVTAINSVYLWIYGCQWHANLTHAKSWRWEAYRKQVSVTWTQ